MGLPVYFPFHAGIWSSLTLPGSLSLPIASNALSFLFVFSHRGLNRDFSTEEYQMAKRHQRNCSTSLVIKEMQTKMILRYYLTPVRMVKLKNTGDNLCWRECGVKGTSSTAGGRANLYSLFGNQYDIFSGNCESTYLTTDPALPLLVILNHTTRILARLCS